MHELANQWILCSSVRLPRSILCPSVRSNLGSVPFFKTEPCQKISALAFQFVSLIRSIVTACLQKRIPLCESIKFHVLYVRNRVYILLMTSSKKYLCCFGPYGCGLVA